MSEHFSRILFAGWSDMDFNGHMRNTAYLDKASDVRMMFFAAHGFAMNDFAHMRIGPVVMKDEAEYFKEVHMLEEIKVLLLAAGMSEDGSRFKIRNEFYRHDGKLAARINSTGGWLDLARRRLIAPPAKLFNAMRNLLHSDDFVELPSSLK
jgi:acyl-CoA thioester hydrolase